MCSPAYIRIYFSYSASFLNYLSWRTSYARVIYSRGSLFQSAIDLRSFLMTMAMSDCFFWNISSQTCFAWMNLSFAFTIFAFSFLSEIYFSIFIIEAVRKLSTVIVVCSCFNSSWKWRNFYTIDSCSRCFDALGLMILRKPDVVCLCFYLTSSQSVTIVLGAPISKEESGVRSIEERLPIESFSSKCLSRGSIIASEDMVRWNDKDVCGPAATFFGCGKRSTSTESSTPLSLVSSLIIIFYMSPCSRFCSDMKRFDRILRYCATTVSMQNEPDMPVVEWSSQILLIRSLHRIEAPPG